MGQSRYPLVRRWTPEEHERLLAMAAAGSRPHEIARALGRTEAAVWGRAHLYNIPLRLVTPKRSSQKRVGNSPSWPSGPEAAK
ncbi:transposase-like protein [Bradyrhizobium sp. GM22.5]